MGCASSSPAVKGVGDSQHIEASYKRARLSQNLIKQKADADPLEHYEIVKRLGVGSMGRVFSVRSKKGNHHRNEKKDADQLHAMKTIRPGRVTSGFVAELVNEIQTVRKLDHPGIVRFHDVYFGEKQISIVMDYCRGGDLHRRSPYTEIQAASIVQQMLGALKYMHGKGYVHLDIKFENIMFTSTDDRAPIKIIDFGFAARYDPSGDDGPLLRKQLGTIDTMAPEVFKGEYTTQADLWSAGVVSYELIRGRKPFAASSPVGVVVKISRGKFDTETGPWKKKSAEAKSFVRSLMLRDPSKRWTANRALRHDWLAIDPSSPDKPVETKSCCGPLEQMVSYEQSPAIKKIGLLMIAHRTFPEEIVELRARFESFDEGNTGVISLEDFQKAVSELDQKFSDDEIRRIFQSMDAYGDGELSYTEFVAAVLEKHTFITEANILDAFERIDVNDSGYICVDDLRLVLGKDF